IFLGTLIDAEQDGQPNVNATGDDSNGAPDEDGVKFLTPLAPGKGAAVRVVASANGKLDGWIDFNPNGSWADAGEKILNSVNLVAGPNVLNFNVPAGAVKECTFARFRFSTAGGLSFDGPAEDGEVEDYEVVINDVPPPPPRFLDHTWIDSNGKETCAIDIVFVANPNIPPPNHPSFFP